MGITWDIHNKNSENTKINKFLKEHMPGKAGFISYRGEKAFDCKSALIVRGSSDSSKASYIGILSEIYIDLIVAKYIQQTELLKVIFPYFDEKIDIIKKIYKKNKFILKRIKKDYSLIRRYVQDRKVNMNDLVVAIANISKINSVPIRVENGQEVGLSDDLNQVYNAIYKHIIDEKVIKEILQIGNVFYDSFVFGGILKPNSDVIISPCWGPWSDLLGMVGDLYIDGVLYDIKSRKKLGFSSAEVEQVYAYYLCNELQNKYIIQKSKMNGLYQPVEEDYNHIFYNMIDKNIEAIALYYSRFGDINMCKIENYKLNMEDLEKFLEIIIGYKTENKPWAQYLYYRK